MKYPKDQLSSLTINSVFREQSSKEILLAIKALQSKGKPGTKRGYFPAINCTGIEKRYEMSISVGATSRTEAVHTTCLGRPVDAQNLLRHPNAVYSN